jgi:hypothetical protein
MTPPQTFSDLIFRFIIPLINLTLVVVLALALLVFLKGLASFIAKSGDAKSHAEGKNLMIWGLVGLFVMVSVFGIVRLLRDDFGFRNPNNPGGILPLLPDKK